MACGSTVLMSPVTGWPERQRLEHPIAFEAAGAASKRRRMHGARVEERTIRRHVERTRDGEGEALGDLFDEFRPDVMRLCTRLLGPVDAEDAANEAFQRAQQRLARYDVTRSFRSWLLSIAAHHCIDRLRRRTLEKRIFEPSEHDVEDLAGPAGSALDLIIQTQRQDSLRAALDRLSDRYRVPLVLRYFVELDYEAIGEELGLTRGQVGSLLFRAKQQLRDLLGDEEETEP